MVHGFFDPEFESALAALDSEESLVTPFQVSYGPEGGPREEVLSVTAAATNALQRFIQVSVCFLGNGLLIVDHTRMDKTEDQTRRRAEAVRTDSWTEATRKLGRIGYLDFDDGAWKDKGPSGPDRQVKPVPRRVQ